MMCVGIIFAGFLITSATVMTVVNLLHRPVTFGPLYLTKAEVTNPDAIKIQREGTGIIHILTDGESDLFFSQGVSHAQVCD